MNSQSLQFSIPYVGFLSFLFLLSCTPSLKAQTDYYMNFLGDGSYVDLSTDDFSPPWTIECKVNKNINTPFSHLLTGSDGGSGVRLEQWYNNNQIGITDYGVSDYFSGYQLTPGIWQHLAVTCNGNNTYLFIDGLLEANISASINCPADLLGLDNTLGALNSKIDELRLWDVQLTQNAIHQFQDSLNLNLHPNFTNLVGHFNFNEGEGQVVNSADTTANGTNFGGIYEGYYAYDVGVLTLDAPVTNAFSYGTNENIDITIANLGTVNITTDFDVSYILNNGDPVTTTISASTTPFITNTTLQVDFPSVDLSESGIHHFMIYTSLYDDDYSGNDTLDLNIIQQENVLGNITSFTPSASSDTITINSGITALNILFYSDDIFRIWMAPTGSFEDPAETDIVVHNDPPITVSTSDEGEYYKINSDNVVLRAYKTPLTFAMYESDNTTLIWEETSPMIFGSETHQFLSRGDHEQFYGCGMRNGYFSHRNQSINISLDISNWSDGSVPGPSPFYLSTAGYGAFRNTFDPGKYDFFSTVDLMHEELRFDCYYFRGPSLKRVLNGYTTITGRPFLPPRWALSFGDADCYNTSGETTMDVFYDIAQEYREKDMPGGWILPNDGYGCGYTALPEVVDSLNSIGFVTGLWTENGLEEQAWEVGTAGTRCSKLDVAWIGSGYRYALDGCREAYHGIEDNSNGRGFVWSVSSWAGTQRYSTVWSGDEYGTWEYIRYHIPTIIGSGLSGLNCATGDVDGIFGGSGPTYTRDLQWKCFTPVLMTISGWASVGKQPWSRGLPYTNINRDYLKLKMRLTPYMYTYCNEAYETGVPAVRGMVLEYPEDSATWGKRTQYQFMTGESFLVAPVYENSSTRDSIYFPEGKWIDYWDGERYFGPITLDDYSAPLEKLPLFVKAGSIIPMYPEMLYDNEKPIDTLTLDVYPFGQSSFTMYEDDGMTKEHRTGFFTKQTFTSNAPTNGIAPITLNVGASVGDFTGKLLNRSYLADIHVEHEPDSVMIDNLLVPQYVSADLLQEATEGWFFDPDEKNGMVHIKTPSMPTSYAFDIYLAYDVDLTFSVHDETDKLIKIYPNPSTGIVQISNLNLGKDVLVEVYGTSGKRIKGVSTIDSFENEIEIDLSMHLTGVYIVKIRTEGRMITKRIVLFNHQE
ncbi:MAG: DUF4968 domain-containing protein [Flavobacteriales bacterium]|nr:DUF4968 domain-containing protein [Flavobacteriales bacterium]